MNDLISKQAVLDIVDDLRDRMTVEGYWSMVERVKALATNLQQTCNFASNDCISRQAVIDALQDRYKLYSWDDGGAQKAEIGAIIREIYDMPSAQPVDKDIDVPSTDTISRQDAIRIVDGIDTWQAGWRGNAIESIKALPFAQPDIVACGDCKHWICHDRRCGFWNHGVKPLDWCCHAERRTDE